ncbi:MAG: ribosome maturation factor RimM [Bacteroidales bacterium]
MIRKEEIIKIGQFNKPHGIHGELSFTFTTDLFDRGDCRYFVCEMDGIYVPFFIEQYRFRSENGALVKLDRIDSDHEARQFTNKEVFFPIANISKDEPEGDDDNYFVGFLVKTKQGEEIGRIVEVDDTTVNVLFVVENAKGDELLVPAADDFVVSIDSDNLILTMDLPEGMLDL